MKHRARIRSWIGIGVMGFLMQGGLCFCESLKGSPYVEAGAGSLIKYNDSPERYEYGWYAGVRGGFYLRKKTGLETYVLFARTKAELPGYGSFRIDVLEMDVSGFREFTVSKHVTAVAFGGFGYLRSYPQGGEMDAWTTVHAGVAVKIHLSEKVYLRPDVRFRYIDHGNLNQFDAGVMVGTSWKR